MDIMAVDPDFAKAIIQNIGLRWSKEELCDLKITVGERMFACNQFTLCACSEFFDVLLHPGPSTTKTKHFPEIRISGISPDTFSLVLNALFKGDNQINAENIIELWYAASHLQINFLIQKCEAFIVDELTLDNYFNVYPHALILKSEVVLDKILGIFTSNFEQLRHIQTFLDMPAETLFKLIDRKDFESYDSVIDFIIQWVEKDDGKKEESTCNMIDSTSFKNIDDFLHQCLKDEGDTFVEVIFRNEMLHPEVVKTPVKRKDLLGTLLTRTQLNQVSYKGLKVLLENDRVMDNRAARNAVVKALDTVLEVEKQVTSCSDTALKTSENKTVAPVKMYDIYDNLVPVVLFVKNQKLIAFSILTNQFFKLDVFLPLDDILIHNNQMYAFFCKCNVEERVNIQNFYTFLKGLKIHLVSRVIANVTEAQTSIYHEPFLYKLILSYRKIEIYRMKFTKNRGSGEWTHVAHIKTEFCKDFISCVTTSILKKYLLIFLYGNDDLYYVYYFHTNTRLSNFKVPVFGRTDGKNDYLVTFNFNESLFVLNENGNLTEVSEKDGDIECQSHPPLWNFFIKLYGAAVLDQTLYIFADLETKRTLPTSCQFASIKFVQFLKDAGRCHFVKVSQDWLTTEV